MLSLHMVNSDSVFGKNMVSRVHKDLFTLFTEHRDRSEYAISFARYGLYAHTPKNPEAQNQSKEDLMLECSSVVE